jgi:hypothetical protein
MISLQFEFVILCLSLSSAFAAICSVCGDESSTIQNPNAAIPLLNIPGPIPITCQVAYDYASILEDTDPACDLLQQQAIYCQCQNATMPTADQACSLCSGKSMILDVMSLMSYHSFFSYQTLPLFSLLYFETTQSINQFLDGSDPSHPDRSTAYGDTCQELNAYLNTFTKEQCQNLDGTHIPTLLESAFGCGCPNAAAATCPMCESDGTIDIAYPDRVIPFLSWNDGMITGGEVSIRSNPTCQELAMLATTADESSQLCQITQAQAGFCGCAGVAPLDDCSFCPDGAPPAKMGDFVVDTFDSCNELNEYMTFMTNDECQSERANDMRALSYSCGCKDTLPQCTLCPDGTNNFNPDLIPVKDGPSCLELALSVAGLTTDACNEQRKSIIGINAFRCGCPGAEPPACASRQNTNMCTQGLIDKARTTQAMTEQEKKECECLSFCDGEFLQCHDYPVSKVLHTHTHTE